MASAQNTGAADHTILIHPLLLQFHLPIPLPNHHHHHHHQASSPLRPAHQPYSPRPGHKHSTKSTPAPQQTPPQTDTPPNPPLASSTQETASPPPPSSSQYTRP